VTLGELEAMLVLMVEGHRRAPLLKHPGLLEGTVAEEDQLKWECLNYGRREHLRQCHVAALEFCLNSPCLFHPSVADGVRGEFLAAVQMAKADGEAAIGHVEEREGGSLPSPPSAFPPSSPAPPSTGHVEQVKGGVLSQEEGLKS
jgi:hypothetical protein